MPENNTNQDPNSDFKLYSDMSQIYITHKLIQNNSTAVNSHVPVTGQDHKTIAIILLSCLSLSYKLSVLFLHSLSPLR